MLGGKKCLLTCVSSYHGIESYPPNKTSSGWNMIVFVPWGLFPIFRGFWLLVSGSATIVELEFLTWYSTPDM